MGGLYVVIKKKESRVFLLGKVISGTRDKFNYRERERDFVR